MSYQKYYLANRDDILEQKKQYYLENQTQLIDNKKIYYTLNRDKIKQRNNRKLLCDCGSIITFCNFKRHLGSMKHKDYLLHSQ
jgi:ribonucleotide monophosphatase NagD (HAD superfamily)